MADYTKFKDYWKSLGKPPVEYRDTHYSDFRTMVLSFFDDKEGE